MPVKRVLAVMLIVATGALAADGPSTPIKVEVETLGGKNFRGELVSIDATQIVLKTDKDEQKIPIAQVLTVTTDRQPHPPAKTYTLVQLNDGAEFRCESVDLKKNEATLKLVSGTSIKIPLKNVKFLLKEAHDKKIQDQWQPIVAVKRTNDVVVVLNGERQLNVVDGTIGGADDEGKTISFVLKETNAQRNVALGNVAALIFARGPVSDARPQIFKCQDVDGNTIPVAALMRKEGGYTLTTVGNTTIDYPADALVKLDFSKGKLMYLSDFEFKEKFHYNLEENQEQAKLVFGPVKDGNLNRSGPIRIQGATFKKGLSLHAHTELSFNVDGKYEWFNTVIGFDDDISGVTTSVIVEIFGDGKELKSVKLDRTPAVAKPQSGSGEQAPRKIEVNIKDVNQLRIIVRRGDQQSLDFGCGVEFGDARVNK